jgi:hypothetical protein
MIQMLASAQLNREKVDETSFGDSVINKQKEKKDKKSRDELEKIYLHYEKNLKKELGDRNFMCSLTPIFHFTITYIENNITKFSKIMNIPVCSEFKLDTAVGLLSKIKEIEEAFNVLPSGFFVETINHMCTLIYPKITLLSQPCVDLPEIPVQIYKPEKRDETKNLKRRKSVISTNFLHKK